MSSSDNELDEIDKETLTKVKKLLLAQRKRKEETSGFVEQPKNTRKRQKGIEQQQLKDLEGFNDRVKKYNDSLKQYTKKLEEFHAKSTGAIKKLVNEREMLMKEDKQFAEEAKAFNNMNASGVLKGLFTLLFRSYLRLLCFRHHHFLQLLCILIFQNVESWSSLLMD